MAELKPVPPAATETSATSATDSPNLAAVPDPKAPKSEATEPPERRRSAWLWVGLLAVALVLALWGLYHQTQLANSQATEIGALQGELAELQTELEGLTSQLTQFGMQRELVEATVGDLVERLARLQSLVAWDPSTGGSAPEATSEATGEDAAPEAAGQEAAGEEAGAAPEASAPSEGEAGPAAADPDTADELGSKLSLQLAPDESGDALTGI